MGQNGSAHLHQVPQAAGHQQHIPRRQALEVQALQSTIQLAAGDQAAAQPAPRGWGNTERFGENHQLRRTSEYDLVHLVRILESSEFP